MALNNTFSGGHRVTEKIAATEMSVNSDRDIVKELVSTYGVDTIPARDMCP